MYLTEIEKIDNEKYRDQIVDKIYDLYVMTWDKYLLLTQDDGYKTVDWKKSKKLAEETNTKNKSKKLAPYRIKDHLLGKYTIGVFAGNTFTKFICFDVDYRDNELAKDVVRKIRATLVDYNIPKENIYVSWSGNKGYHVEIFFKNSLTNKMVKNFFNLILHEAGLEDFRKGKVELMPIANHGVKIPLGFNFKNLDVKNRKCHFVNILDDGSFETIRLDRYILEIEKIPHNLVRDAVNYNMDILNEIDRGKYKKEQKNSNSILTQHKNLDIYSLRVDKGYTIERIKKREQEGIKCRETRHKMLMDQTRLYKCEYGYEREETKQKLIEWMRKQDPKNYSTSFEDSNKEIYTMVDYAYDRDYQLLNHNVKIDISEEDIIWILGVPQKNGKLLLFTLLVHSRRFATRKGKFFMSLKQMSEASGLSEKTCGNQIKKLVEGKYIEKLEVDLHRSITEHRANYFRILKDIPEFDAEKIVTIDFLNNGKKDRELFLDCLNSIEDMFIKRRLTRQDYSDLKKGCFC